ncbi:hypothetical protein YASMINEVIRUS_1062 [Yasminevirus sp. GU-2018]|uniref:Uncharacterized protein n=1 Tax=Yasminevirus sp. GU-2018 TaxID=2420051 RepID=A0A5K0U8W4_9VIRU|nr:hypothetical protein YASMINEVIRUS_1062 [Yasminevirus sp. GU-2018]
MDLYLTTKKDYMSLISEEGDLEPAISEATSQNFTNEHMDNITTDLNDNSLDNLIGNQKGGGAWSTYSSQNDSTYDMISMYKISEYDESTDEHIYHSDVKATDIALKQMFKSYEKYTMDSIKKSGFVSKLNTKDGVDFYDVPHAYSYLGVITWMLEHNYCVRLQYLYRALALAYSEYFKIITVREASGWRSWQDREKAVIDEIRLINYAINTAKAGVSNLSLQEKNVYSEITSIFKKTPAKVMDNHFISHKKRKPTYSFQKYYIEPGLDPKLLQIGTIMMGHEGRQILQPFIVTLNPTTQKKMWREYNVFDSIYGSYIEDSHMIKLYGNEYYRKIKRPVIKNKSKSKKSKSKSK